MVREEMHCRICGKPLRSLLDFGEIYPSAFVKDQTNLTKVPLVLAQCKECGLVQLKHTVELDFMYRQYWYRSGLNKSMLNDLKNIVDDIEKTIELNPGDTVVDIGCNDGSLFKYYNKDKELKRVGFDPAENLSDVYLNTDLFINDYFPTKYPIKPLNARVITSIAMFYDLPDPHKFVEAISNELNEDGIWVIQFTDLVSMIELTAFDNICHEHLEYYRLRDIIGLLKQHGLEVFKVSHNNVNGGSIRIFACHEGKRTIENSVFNYLRRECMMLKSGMFDVFFKNISSSILVLRNILDYLVRSKGKTVFVTGASTKGNTLLQIADINGLSVPYAAEVNKEKFKLFTVGTNIEIIPEDEAMKMKPDYFLVLPWHFKNTFIEKYREYILDGGSLIFPLPYIEIIGKEELNGTGN